MADHKAIAIVDAIRDLFLDLPLTGDNVFKGRTYDLENMPSHSLYLGSADATQANIVFEDQSQLIRDEIFVTAGREEDLDALLLNVHAESYAAIATDRTLGLAGVVADTVFEGMSEPDYIDEGKRPVLSAVFTWRVNYRHSYDDPRA